MRYTRKQIDDAFDMAERYIHQCTQPRHEVTDDDETFDVCWIQRLARAQHITRGMGERGEKAMKVLNEKWDLLWKTTDKAIILYHEMCKSAGIKPENIYVPPCTCRYCVGSWEQRHDQRDSGGSHDQRDSGGSHDQRDSGGSHDQRDSGGSHDQRDNGGRDGA